MEEVLDTYQRPLDPRHPVVCVDELSKTLHAHVRSPQAPRPGQAARQDYEFKRQGHRNLCMMTAPCLSWRIPDTDTLVRETAAWCRRRNQTSAPVQWRFTTADAQIKLRRLYPTI